MSCPSSPAWSIELRARLPVRAALAVACVVVSAMSASSARAYSTPDAYSEQPALGGGGGRWFSGSPADGFGCSACHAPAKGQRTFPLRVAGLPSDGYAPGQRQEIVLGWPEFSARWTELRPDPTAPAVVGQPSPALGLIGELVAESGLGSGTIEIDSAAAGPDELCETTRPNLKPRLAARLYQVRPGIAPLLIRPDSTGIMRCESRQLGQRCIVALSSCGSKLLRFAWTAPPTWEGPIWFAAGFVASEALSGTPANDSVDEVSVPIVQADAKGEDYRQVLRGGCAVSVSSAGDSRAPAWAMALGLGLAGLVYMRRGRRRRRRPRRSRAALTCVLLSCLAGACDVERAPVEPSAYPTAGLYTPGSPLGASDPTDMPVEGAGLGDRCDALPPPAAGTTPTTGALEVVYKTQSLDGRYAPRNCTAVWIETAAGQYVATIELGAGLRKPGLVYFQDHACTARLGPDVVTSATLADHEKMHMAKWESLDFEDKLVADGAYKLFIEVTESDKEPGEVTEFAFDKGPVPFELEAPVDFEGPLAQVRLKWTVMAATQGGGSAGGSGN